ncbi:hypothetical protein GZH53_06160 [Flavihumibacter sp. R14]|nr:hypothetical protein [Flavihumibacter soli]
MFSKIQFSRVVILLCIALFLTPAYNSFAGQKPRNYDAIVSTTNHRYKGFLIDVNEKGLTIDYFGMSKFISADSINTIKIKRSSALKRHALVGSAIGLAAGIPVYADGNNKGKLSSLALPVVLIGTTLTGALVGSLVNTITATQRFDKINSGNSFKSIQPVLLRYSKASPTRVPVEAR